MAFNAQGLLDQLLRSGQSMIEGQRQAVPGDARDAGGLAGQLGGFGGGAAVGGALGLLLGSKRMRKFGGGIASHGGAAALGALAYRAYTEWQAQQGRQAVGAAAEEPRTLDRVSGEEAQRQSLAILTAIVGAAKADGHVDERERAAIEAEIGKHDGAAELRAWLDEELRKPVDPAAVAAAADSPAVASEIYLASRLVVDSESFMERAYLDELARRLGLDPDLKARLDRI